jgi:hypothetical protein
MSKSVFVIVSLVVAVVARPQSVNELALGTKAIEQQYYNSDVNIFSR